jgi:hypothetical protein
MLFEIFEGYVLLNLIFAFFTVILLIAWYFTKENKYAQLAALSFIIALPF